MRRPLIILLLLIAAPAAASAQSCSVWFDQNPITAGQGTYLRWSTSDIMRRQNCSMTISNIGTVATWNCLTTTMSGSVWIAPGATTGYVGYFNRSGSGTVTCGATLIVNPATPPPTCTLSTDWDPVNKHVGTVMRWSTTNASTFSINQGVGSVSPVAGGSTTIMPQVTTTYTGTATGAGGTATCTKTVTVTPDPTGTLTLGDSYIAAGDSTTLTWATTDAYSVFIMSDEGSGQFPAFGGSGAVSANGSTSVSPGVTTAYTLYVYGYAGDTNPVVVTKTLHVTSCSVSLSPNPITRGESSTLSYSSSEATTFSIENVGSMTPNTSGSTSVSPAASTDYTGTAVKDTSTVTYGSPVTITLASGSSWTVPSDWNSADNTITVKGGDGGGVNAGTGQTAFISNLTLTPGAAVSYTVGAGGAVAAAGGSTYFNGASCGGSSVCGTGGTAGTVGSPGSQTFTSSDTFTVPEHYGTLTVEVWGGGGGGGGTAAGAAGGSSSFGSVTATGGQGGGAWTSGSGGAGGTGSNGDINSTGVTGGARATTCGGCSGYGGAGATGGSGGAGFHYPTAGTSGSSPGGGGGGGWNANCGGGCGLPGGGGGGGYAKKTYQAGSLTGTIAVTVGSGGSGSPSSSGPGAPGQVNITWTGSASAGTPGSITITYTPRIVHPSSVSATCPAALTVQCTPSTAYTCSGSAIVRTVTNAACATTVTNPYATCTAPAFCAAGSSSCLYPNPSFSGDNGHLRAVPSLVPTGQTAKVYWQLDNVSSCTVTGDNGDSWSAASSGSAGKTTAPVLRRTTYTLRCTAYPGGIPATIEESATVDVVPVFEEV